MPTHQSSHERSIRSAGSYDDIEHPAKLVTMGTVMVAFFEATAVDVSVVTMTSTLRRMRSATKPEIPTLDPTEVAETPPKPVEGYVASFWERSALRPLAQVADAVHLPDLLSLGRSRSESAESEHDREPDPPHRHLGGGWLVGV